MASGVQKPKSFWRGALWTLLAVVVLTALPAISGSIAWRRGFDSALEQSRRRATELESVRSEEFLQVREDAGIEIGRAMARADIAAGKLQVVYSHDWGHYPPWYREYQAILSNKYGVEFQKLARPDATLAYNEESVAAINRRFGKDVFADAKREAQQNWKPIPKPDEAIDK